MLELELATSKNRAEGAPQPQTPEHAIGFLLFALTPGKQQSANSSGSRHQVVVALAQAALAHIPYAPGTAHCQWGLRPRPRPICICAVPLGPGVQTPASQLSAGCLYHIPFLYTAYALGNFGSAALAGATCLLSLPLVTAS